MSARIKQTIPNTNKPPAVGSRRLTWYSKTIANAANQERANAAVKTMTTPATMSEASILLALPSAATIQLLRRPVYRAKARIGDDANHRTVDFSASKQGIGRRDLGREYCAASAHDSESGRISAVVVDWNEEKVNKREYDKARKNQPLLSSSHALQRHSPSKFNHVPTFVSEKKSERVPET